MPEQLAGSDNAQEDFGTALAAYVIAPGRQKGLYTCAPYNDSQCCTAGAHRGAHMSVLSPHSMSVSPLTMTGPLLLN